MRNVSWLVLVVACGGSSRAPQQPIANTAPPTASPAPVAAAGLDKAVCSQRADTFGPITLTAAQVDLRHGAKVAKLADFQTSKENPVEVCSPSGQRAWLGGVACADGSKPTGAQRNGNVGPGGRCDSIIDLYVVGCPEKQYDVYMDMYMCGPDESF